jgi:transposase
VKSGRLSTVRALWQAKIRACSIMTSCTRCHRLSQGDSLLTIRRRYEVSDEEWEHARDLLPPERTGKPGQSSGDNRTALNGILWIARSGAPWRDLPERYGSWSSALYDKVARWSDLDVFEKIFDMLGIDADMQDLSIDSASIKVRQRAAGAKRGFRRGNHSGNRSFPRREERPNTRVR